MAARKDRFFYVKLAVSVFLLGYVFNKVGWTAFIDTLRNTDPLFMFLNLAISPVLILVSVMKWQIFLRAKNIHATLSHLFKLYLLGNFFNHFLPSNVGGDAIRSYKLGKETGKFEEVLASVFLERMTGFTVLLLLALAVAAANLQFLQDIKVSVAVGSAFVGYVALMWMTLDPRPLAFCIPKLHFRLLTRIALKLQKFQTAIQAYQDSTGIWLPVMGSRSYFTCWRL
jgi:uncharacterized protein (TIRG00374 family)